MLDVFRFLQRARRSERRNSKPGRQVFGLSLYHRRLACEALEARMLLSVAVQIPAGCSATPIADPYFLGPADSGSSTPYGLTPNQVRGAYGLGSYTSGVLSNGITFTGGIPGDGRGQTIAIVDAYDDPNALSDLNAFSSYSACQLSAMAGSSPSFQKLRPAARRCRARILRPYSTGDSDWEKEESLDIEWAHVMAPLANIILFEASDTECWSLYGGPDRQQHARRGGRLDELERG